jgi:predicted DNA-binding transcriptional regulator AlpA
MDEDDTARADRARKGSPFLTPQQAAHYLGLKVQTLYSLRWKGTGPRFRKHSRYVRYHIDDLDAWSRERTTRGTFGDASDA